MSFAQRVLTALALAAASLVMVTSPAQAAAATSVHVSGKTLFIVGTSGGEIVNVSFLEGKLTVDSNSGIVVGAGCSKSGAVAQCSGAIQFLDVSLLGGNDTFSNGTNLQSTVLGGAGRDVLNGGSGRDGLNGGSDDDILKGNDGIDTANGVGGFDKCTAETETACEADA
ncbi:hypothetical protein [Herbidospora sp. NBRC 101105]|uniref:hypothetical protein n=1 Tax=Herbidospora sp. NBRC 101105 TaxID=3032195 RepID=UPI0024A37E77|nr:hypothetical protein [Herbidospora sp. NBRC 101105]GLX93246.1 hypothetical protein Hesp01_11960 [Herbidospora sp. NBRC 101105]